MNEVLPDRNEEWRVAVAENETLLEHISCYVLSLDHMEHSQRIYDSDCSRCVAEAAFATPLATARKRHIDDGLKNLLGAR
jgi:hypothetical protein